MNPPTDFFGHAIGYCRPAYSDERWYETVRQEREYTAGWRGEFRASPGSHYLMGKADRQHPRHNRAIPEQHRGAA